MFEDLEDDEFLDDDSFGAEEESGNRTFVIAAIALGVLTVIAIICLGVFLFTRSQTAQRDVQMTEQAVAFDQQTQEALSVEQTIEVQSWTATPTDTPVPTETPTPTEVVALPPATEQEKPTEDPATATIAALLTQAAEQPTQDPSAIASITVIVTDQLPDTGVFDDFGVTGLILLAFFALVVIFLARRMRTANR